MRNAVDLKRVEIEPKRSSLYVSPIVWKGDPVGHVGESDVFFFVLTGECYLEIEDEVHIVRSGELAFLPMGKRRRYTQTSRSFALYEISFSASVGGENLMAALGFAEENFVVGGVDAEELKRLFEASARVEMQKDPIQHLSACVNTLSLIRIYCEARARLDSDDRVALLPITKYMSEHLGEDITLSDLSSIACASPTYFIRKFRAAYGTSPMSHLGQLRIYKAMSYLSGTDMPIEDIASAVGIHEASYFARVFKKHTGATPTEYRLAFKTYGGIR